jgi:hypothetical protein
MAIVLLGLRSAYQRGTSAMGMSMGAFPLGRCCRSCGSDEAGASKLS